VDSRQLRRARRKRALQRQRLATAVTVLASLVAVVLIGCRPSTAAIPAAQKTEIHRVVHPRTWRPPQFVVVSFDGSGGVRLWPYWRSVARRAHAHFTFFVSGVYLLDEARRKTYRAPRHSPGTSDIGFAQAEGDRSAREIVRGTLAQIVGAYREGHEIGTHFNGHFCAPYDGNVDEWTSSDWRQEIHEFNKLLFGAAANNHLPATVGVPFGSDKIIGGRTPCLQGDFRALYPVLAAHGFRYDASQVGRLGDWPRRERGLWNTPLLEIPFVGHTFDVVSMDYNFMANQTGTTAETIERETYLSLRRAFFASYFGNRAPISIGNHFETWSSWAYDHAVARLLGEVCPLPEVRCASFRELVDWLDAQSPRRLRRARLGKFRHLKRP
jgi:peptidoglycan/xylan/chitin deacetylase (PgdA/CDA1 family)